MAMHAINKTTTKHKHTIADLCCAVDEWFVWELIARAVDVRLPCAVISAHSYKERGECDACRRKAVLPHVECVHIHVHPSSEAGSPKALR